MVNLVVVTQRVGVIEEPNPLQIVSEPTTIEVIDPPNKNSNQIVVPMLGPQGPAGQSLAITKTAGQTLSAHRVVYADIGSDKLFYFDPSNIALANVQVYFTLSAADANTQTSVIPIGTVSDPSFNLAGGPVYSALNGMLTQVLPTTGVVKQVATALSATSLYFNPQPAIVLAN